MGNTINIDGGGTSYTNSHLMEAQWRPNTRGGHTSEEALHQRRPYIAGHGGGTSSDSVAPTSPGGGPNIYTEVANNIGAELAVRRWRLQSEVLSTEGPASPQCRRSSILTMTSSHGSTTRSRFLKLELQWRGNMKHDQRGWARPRNTYITQLS